MHPDIKVLVESLKKIPSNTSIHYGKVRTIVAFTHLSYQDKSYDNVVVLIADDTMSAYDHVFPKPFSGKGEILTEISTWWFTQLKDVCPNHFLDQPSQRVTIAKACKPLPIEIIVRGFLTGSAWKDYQKGIRNICGVLLPDGMQEFDAFPEPIITPTTKAPIGRHDENTTAEKEIAIGNITPEQWETIKTYAIDLFTKGTEISKEKKLILVDTKFEFGVSIASGELLLIDEVLTPDSSRFLDTEDFYEFQAGKRKADELIRYSKQDFRDWLKRENFTNQPGERVPIITQKIIDIVMGKYEHIYKRLLGSEYKPQPTIFPF